MICKIIRCFSFRECFFAIRLGVYFAMDFVRTNAGFIAIQDDFQLPMNKKHPWFVGVG
jgi:hypothetical protein